MLPIATNLYPWKSAAISGGTRPKRLVRSCSCSWCSRAMAIAFASTSGGTVFAGCTRTENGRAGCDGVCGAEDAPWHFLYFFPLPHGQMSLLPTFCFFMEIHHSQVTEFTWD